MFAIDPANEPLQWHLEFLTAIEPCPVHSVAGAINIAIPNPFEAHQNIASKTGAKFFEFVGKGDRRFARNPRNRSEWPFVSRPIVRRDQVCNVTEINQPTGEPFQVGLGPAAR